MKQSVLRERLKNPDEAERLRTVNEVLSSEHQPGVSVQLVLQLERETSQVVREAIVFTLQKNPQPECFESLFTLFRSDDAYLRNAAMTIFGLCGQGSLDFLERQLISADREVRKLILDACVQIGTPEAVKTIRSALYDPAVNVRITAADYLGQLRDVESTDLLLRLFVDDDEPMFRVSVLESLSVMGDRKTCSKVLDFSTNATFSREDEALFLPVLLRIAGNCNSLDVLAKLLMHLPSLRLYAEDVIVALQNVPDLPEPDKYDQATASQRSIIERVLRELAEERTIRSDLRFAGLILLERMGQNMPECISEGLVASFPEPDFRELVHAMAHPGNSQDEL